MKKIVIIGGGTGPATLLKGLKKYPLCLSVVVSTADDGGSTGILRKTMGVLPPGDMRQCLVALSSKPKLAEEFNFRFSSGKFKGHVLGNLVLANLEKKAGINEALEIISRSLCVKGEVLPVSLKSTKLSAVLENGKKIVGEHNIDEGRQDLKSPIKDLRLSKASVNPKVVRAIKEADAIVFGPGDLYTSTLPNILVAGVKEAINKSSAKKIFITNIMTKAGQTDGFKASDFVKVLEKYLKGKVDIVLANNKKPPAHVLKRYAKEKAIFVEPDVKEKAKARDLISSAIIKKKAGDTLKRSFLRHDSQKLAKLILKFI